MPERADDPNSLDSDSSRGTGSVICMLCSIRYFSLKEKARV